MGDGVTHGYNEYVPPVEVVGIDDAVDVSLSDRVACVVRESGQVACWGPVDGFGGRFANPMYTSSNIPVPATLLTATDIVRVEVGEKSTCALGETGELWCWAAYDGIGILGRGALSAPDPQTPGPVVNVEDFVEVSNGGLHVCGRSVTGLMTCWGGNTFDIGELGTGHGVPGYFVAPVVVRGEIP